MQNDQNCCSDSQFREIANVCYLLSIKRFDAIQSLKIYKTYMHFGQIAYTGKKSQVLKLEIFSRMNETCNLNGIAFLTDTNS